MKTISIQQVKKKLKSENGWWEAPHAIPVNYSGWSPRPYLALLYPLITDRSINRAVVLMGPRRVGKTVMIHHAINKLIKQGIAPDHICYVSIDHPIYNGLNLDDFLELYMEITGIDYHADEVYFFFDEIQYLKEWERYLKTIVDRCPTAKCIVSGSAAAALRLKSSESGAGRFTDFLLPPLTFYEYLHLLDKLDLIEISEDQDGDLPRDFQVDNIEEFNRNFLDYINYGGYPEVIFSDKIKADPGRFIKNDIIDKVLLRDLPGLYGIQDIQELNYLFTTLAYNTANEVSLNELSQNSGIAKNTIKKYIEYLEAAFLVRLVHRVDRNAKRFKRANFFKIYLTNPSIRTALFSPATPDDENLGDLVETAIFSQWFHSKGLLHYARWNSGEVDIVKLDEKNQSVSWAVEVKWSDRFYDRPKELKSLVSFCHAQQLTHPLVTTISKQGSKVIENVHVNYFPASLYCFALGYNIIAGKFKTTTKPSIGKNK
ncbi:MAG: ATP-binding protein [Deltaproteobacteria bacterium]|nr:ATP-binding protein [Candidatus Tharpella aukensis]